MYKNLIRLVWAIITNPGKTWKELAEKNERGDEVLTKFVYPLIGLVTLAAFVGVLFTQKSFSTELALRLAIKALVSSFGGFFLASYLMNEVWKSIFMRGDNPKLCRRFIGYASIMMYALDVILNLLPEDFLFMSIFVFYTVYIVWEGAHPYMGITKGKISVSGLSFSTQMFFTVVASILIIALPVLIRIILFMLMPGLRVK